MPPSWYAGWLRPVDSELDGRCHIMCGDMCATPSSRRTCISRRNGGRAWPLIPTTTKRYRSDRLEETPLRLDRTPGSRCMCEESGGLSGSVFITCKQLSSAGCNRGICKVTAGHSASYWRTSVADEVMHCFVRLLRRVLTLSYRGRHRSHTGTGWEL